MEREYLAAALVMSLGLCGAANAAQLTSDGSMAVKENQSVRSSAAESLKLAHNGAKGVESSCKGKESSCKGKESSCKGKESSCKGKESSCKGKVCKVGGAAMYPSKDIIDNAVNSPIHTTLVTAVKAAGLVDTLKGAGPFTVFAPTDAAFKKLPDGTVESLLKPESKETLTKILTYHVVPGRLDAATLKEQIKSGGGSAKLKTVQGEDLTAKLRGGKVELVDAKGNDCVVSQCDVFQSNGVIHVVDSVLMP